VEVLKVKGATPPTLLVRPTEPLTALGCPVPGRPLEVVLDEGEAEGAARGDALRIRRQADSLRWTLAAP
jgi:predicted aconitase with swiveling domain